MSNRSRSLFIIFIVLVLLVVTVAPASARATKTRFTAQEFFVEDIYYGDETFPDGRSKLRDGVSVYQFEATDPRIDNGRNLITINWNFKLMPEPVYYSGRMWGTFEITNDGGCWKGTWNGVRDENGFSYFQYVGVGCGSYEGLELRMRGERLDPNPMLPPTYHGVIIEPHK